MKQRTIDINSDVGEGIGNEQQLMPLISSCNIACGGHTGDENTIRNTIRLALQNGVKIGAHPSYPDKENFGRKVIDIPSEKLQQSIQDQLGLFCRILNEEGGSLHHIKPHGALYNQIALDKELAQIFLDSIQEYKDSVYLFVPFSSEIEALAKGKGYKVLYEVFGDRNYNQDLSLVSRKNKNALITEPLNVLKHIKRMAINGLVKTVESKEITIQAETFCIHGDTPSALEILMYLQQELPNHQLKIAK